MRKISHPFATLGFIIFILSITAFLIFSPFVERILSNDGKFFDKELTLLHEQLQEAKTEPVDKEKLIQSFANKYDPTVSVSASVAENPINRWVSELKNKETSLVHKERLIQEKEEEFRKRDMGFLGTQRLLVAGIFLLLGLVILNFYFDYERSLELLRER